MTTDSSTINLKQTNIRSTATFKLLKERQQLTAASRHANFSIRFQQIVAEGENIGSYVQKPSKSARWWRLYFEKNLKHYQKAELAKLVGSTFEFLLCNDQLEQNSNVGLLINANNLLIERIHPSVDRYFPSKLDYNCLIVLESLQNNGQYLLDLYHQQCIQESENWEFNCAISIKIREEYLPFYLVCKNKILYVLKDPVGHNPQLQIKQSNLEETVADVAHNMLIIKNLSPRIIAIKFQQDCRYSRNNEALHILISNPEIYQSILFRINRIKYRKYHFGNRNGQSWHSPDTSYKIGSQVEPKATPDKSNSPLQRPQIPPSLIKKIANFQARYSEVLSTETLKKTKDRKMTFNDQKSLKVSRKMENSQKQSNLVASEMTYPVSAEDKTDRESPYLDQFQNLLFEQEVSDEKQLALNDSFEQFQKNENSEKNKEIIEKLNRRKQRQLELKKTEEGLKQKIKHLIGEQSQLIDQNMQLKMEIKMFKITQTPIVIQKKIEHIRTKIASLTAYQQQLVHDLTLIKKESNQISTVECDDKLTLQSTQNTNCDAHNENIDQKILQNSPALDTYLKNYDIRQTEIISQSLVSTVNDDQSLYKNYLNKFGSNKLNSKLNMQSMVSSIMQDIDQSAPNVQDDTRYSAIATKPVRRESDFVQPQNDGMTGFMSLIYASDEQYKK